MLTFCFLLLTKSKKIEENIDKLNQGQFLPENLSFHQKKVMREKTPKKLKKAFQEVFLKFQKAFCKTFLISFFDKHPTSLERFFLHDKGAFEKFLKKLLTIFSRSF